jgi:preprotein translocase subunit SecE
MNTKTDTLTSSTVKLETLKWLLILSLIGGGVAGFYYFSEEASLVIRVVGLLGMVGVAILFAAIKTNKGQAGVAFLRDSHTEVRRVVWPTRQDTVQMTGVVLFMVLFVAVFIWLLDSLLMWLVRLLTGQGG